MERLDAGEIIVGDGGNTHALEKRGYVKAGPWTPECTVEHPEAGEHCKGKGRSSSLNNFPGFVIIIVISRDRSSIFQRREVHH